MTVTATGFKTNFGKYLELLLDILAAQKNGMQKPSPFCA